MIPKKNPAGGAVQLLAKGISEEKRTERIERELVPFLLKMSRVPKGTPARAIVARAAGAKGEISSLLSSAEREYLKRSGRVSMQECIRKEFLPYSAKSRLVKIFSETIVIGISNNFDASDLVRKSAMEIQELSELESRRKSSLSVQKYTILSAGGLFVPFILGATAAITDLAGELSRGLASFGLSAEFQKSPLLSVALLAYSIALPAMSGAFVGIGIEGRKRNAIAYLAILVPVSIAVFFFGKGLIGP